MPLPKEQELKFEIDNNTIPLLTLTAGEVMTQEKIDKLFKYLTENYVSIDTLSQALDDKVKSIREEIGECKATIEYVDGMSPSDSIQETFDQTIKGILSLPSLNQ